MRTRTVRKTKTITMRHHNKHIRYFLGGLFAGIGNIVGSSINAKAQKKINQQNLEAQIQENQKNRDWQEKMYTQYESPQAQAQQMQSAGINPYLQGNVSTQSVGTASTSALPQAQATDIGSGIAAGIASLGELPTAIEQFKQLKTKTKSDEQLLEKQSLEIQSMQYDLYMKSIDAGDYETAHQIKMDTLRESYEFQKASRREKQQLVANAEQAHKLLVEQTRSQKMDNDMLEDAIGSGVNTYVDSHNEIIDRIRSINQSEHDRHQMFLIERDIANNNLDAALALTDKVVTNYDISTTFGVDYDSLPPYLQQEARLLYVSYLRNGDTDPDSVSLLYEQFLEDIATFIESSENKDNPNYLSDKERTELELKRAELLVQNSSKFLDLFKGMFGKGRKSKVK